MKLRILYALTPALLRSLPLSRKAGEGSPAKRGRGEGKFLSKQPSSLPSIRLLFLF
jgi:hypothetical protein